MKKNLIIVFILLFFISVYLFASDCIRGSFFIKNFSPDEYGAFPQVWAIAQDKKGVMYFGNSDGVIVYDGYKWQIIKTAGTVRSLVVDDNDRVYVGMIGDFGFLDTDDTGRMYFKSLKKLLKKKDREFENVFEIFILPTGIYFCEDNKIFRYYRRKINVIPFSMSFRGKIINDLLFTQGENGIYVISGNKFLLLPFTENLIRKVAGRALFLPYDDRRILIISERRGSYLYDISIIVKHKDKIILKTGLKKEQILSKFKSKIDDYVRGKGLYVCKVLDKNLYAISLYDNGIVLMNRKGEIIGFINEKNGLQNNMVFDLYVDESKNLWAALNYGISYIETGSPITFFGKREGLRNIVLDVIKYNNRMYVSSMDGVYYLPDCGNYDFLKSKGFYKIGKYTKNIFTLANYKGMLFAGGEGGVYRVMKDKLQKIITTQFVYKMKVYEKFPDKLIVGQGGALSLLEVKSKEKDKFSVSFQRFKGINNTIREIAEDKNGDLWVSTEQNKFIYIKFKNNNIKDYQIYRIKADRGLPRPVNYIAYRIDEDIIITTSNGFYKVVFPDKADFNFNEIKFVPVKKINNLVKKADNVSIIKKTKDGSVMLGFFDRFRVLVELKDGNYKLLKKPFVKIKGYVTALVEDNDSFWIGTPRGLYRFNRAYKKNYKLPFDTLLRKIVINNQYSYFYNNMKNKIIKLKRYKRKKDSLIKISTFPYDMNSIYFEFTSTFYEFPEKNRYRYKLEGYDEDWSNWVSFHKKEYTNLPPGDYTFRLKSRNIFGRKGKEAFFRFKILPPWYMTPYAYAFYLIAFVLLIYLILYIYSYRSRIARKKLEEIIEERTLQLKKMNEQLQKANKMLKELSVRDPLTGLYNLRRFNEVLETEWKRSARKNTSLGIIMIDVDYFKLYNDTYGHQAGDRCLIEVAKTIKTCVKRPGDVVARYGGEEFIVLLSETEKEGTMKVAERIRKSIEEKRIPHKSSKVSEYVTVSLGCSSTIPEKDIPPPLLIMEADKALYEAKEGGRNRIRYREFNPSENSSG